jgi:hypothetical protein
LLDAFRRFSGSFVRAVILPLRGKDHLSGKEESG